MHIPIKTWSVQRVACWGLFALLLQCAELHSSFAGDFPGETFLVAGRTTYVGGNGDPDHKVGDSGHFFVSITPERALVGWSFVDGNETVETFRLVASHLTHPIGLSFRSALGRNVLEPDARVLSHVFLNSDTTGLDFAGRRDSIEVAAFADYPFALFFSSTYLGVTPEDISSLLHSHDKTVASRHRCGTLTVSKENEPQGGESGRLKEIRFSQAAGDLLTVRGSGIQMADAISNEFGKGMRRAEYTCRFTPPLTDKVAAPWTSSCIAERQWTGGQIVRAEYRINVEAYLTDESRINREIDRILALIPEGEDVQSNEPVEYMWQNQNVVRRIDADGLTRAERLKVHHNRNNAFMQVLVALGAAGVALLTILYLRCRPA